MRTAIRAACGLCLLVSAAGAVAADPVVVEFYTSQGCSSCPPADAYFATLTQDPAVLPLALHVDYWDYIGWEDRFASPAHTARQKAYARAVQSRTIYTPQMIVQGAQRVEGNDPQAVAQAIARAQAEPDLLALGLQRDGATLRITAPALALPGPVVVQLVRYRPEEVVDIAHGENAGQRVTYRNIVTDWQPVGTWTGAEVLDLAVPVEGEAPGAVILQAQGPGAILAAARLP